MPPVEEFYNRVHGKGGRFSTSGTGGGHFAGRAKGAKRPALKKGSTAPAAKSSAPAKKAAPPAAPARSIKAKGSLADRLTAVTAKTATKRKETLRRLSDKKAAASAPKPDAAKANVAKVTARIEAERAAHKAARKPEAKPAPAAQSAHDKGALDAINKVRNHQETGTKGAYADAHKTDVHTATSGPKPAQNKQDSKPVSKSVKVPLSKRIGGFLDKASKALAHEGSVSSSDPARLNAQRAKARDNKEKLYRSRG